MSKFKLFAGRVFLVGITKAITSFRGLLLIPILTKSLGAEGYGIWTQIQVTISLLAPPCALGLGYAIVRFLATENDREKVSTGIISVFSITTQFKFSKDIIAILLP